MMLLMCAYISPACRRRIDVLFIIDLSGSVDQVYDISVNFVNEVVYGMEFRFDTARAALVTFSDDSAVQFYLDTYQVSNALCRPVLPGYIHHK